MKINGGYTKWARKTTESDLFVWRSDKWFKIWFFIINKVNHKDTKYFVRGEGLMTYADIRRGTGATQSQVDKFVRYAKRTTMLTTHKTTRGMIVNVLNYDKYQTSENYKSDTKSDKSGELKAKWKRNGSDTINKNVKNVKNDKRENTLNFLLNIPDGAIQEFSGKFNCYEADIRGKGEDLYNYCLAKGKKYKDYKAFLRNAVKKDFGMRPAILKLRVAEIQISEEDRKRNIAKMAEVRNKVVNKLKV